MKIAHLADIHIRFFSRHDEYKSVFETLYADLDKVKPDRIVIVGDLNHQKINMSPDSLNLSASFLINLAKIAPVDVFLGNHDMNMTQKEQGDTISPMFNLIDKFFELISDNLKKKFNKTFIVTPENHEKINFNEKGVYFFPDSDVYPINDEIVYGVFSCKDNKMVKITRKQKNKKYIAFYHGQIYGARGDNGYELFGKDLMNPQVFEKFDMVMLGDIHEFQTFREDESMAYCGSLIQQDNGESLDKGYLLWDTNTNSFERKNIPNEVGFSKITIAKGESVEERIDNMKFSANKVKTKVTIIWEDYEENYSLEKDHQIVKMVKDKHGCENVVVAFSAIEKENEADQEIADSKNQDTFIEQLKTFVLQNENDIDDETLEGLVDFAQLIDKELNIQENREEIKIWDIDKVIISNIFSFGVEPIEIVLKNKTGLTGIFGKNYTGKSNIVRAIIWGLYQHILEKGDAKKLINLYTKSNKGYVIIYLRFNDSAYRISRHIETTKTKSGKVNNSYPIKYEKLIVNENGEEEWVSEISDRTVNEKVEIKKIITDAIGTFDEFTKVSFQSQSNESSYIGQRQQAKNDLVNKYMGLEFFRDRYAYGNEYRKEIKKDRKKLGDISEIENKIKEIKTEIDLQEKDINKIKKEEKELTAKNQKIFEEINQLNKNIIPLETFSEDELQNLQEAENLLKNKNEELTKLQSQEIQLTEWLSKNHIKELPIDPSWTIESLQKNYKEEDKKFQTQKKQYIELEKWLKTNTKKVLYNITEHDAKVKKLTIEISELQAKIPMYQGKKCHYCGCEMKKPDPTKLNQCNLDIQTKNGELTKLTQEIEHNKQAQTFNNQYEQNQLKLQNLKNSLLLLKKNKETITNNINLLKENEINIKNNAIIQQQQTLLQATQNNIKTINQTVLKLEANKTKIINNENKAKNNLKFEKEIEAKQETKKGYEYQIYNLGEQVVKKTSALTLEKNKLEEGNKLLKEIKEAERKFKIYSLYLQAVHRDGIPAMIIRKKLPIVNNKINSILNSIVDFNLDMKVLQNGDITEEFYFSEDKSDALPLSFASGSQKFICSLVIKDALHYISNILKPSINIIDEGFGTLDDELTAGIINVLYYLKNKYRNVLVITHRNEIKDFVDNIVETYKDTSEIAKETLEQNPKAGITKINTK